MKKLLETVMLTLFMIFVSVEASAATDFYSLSATTARGKSYAFEQLKGKVVVIVNTASKCGYTSQFKELQGIEESYAGKGVVVLGMPSNSFNQEDLDGGKAAEFCETNYGVKFTILEKADVKGSNIHPIFKFLTEKAPETGAITWNFEKFIVDGSGKVVARFGSSVEPSAPEFKAALEKAIAKK